MLACHFTFQNQVRTGIQPLVFLYELFVEQNFLLVVEVDENSEDKQRH